MPKNRYEKMELAKKNKHRKKIMKKKKAERDKKYAEWENLPVEEWTEARKKANDLLNKESGCE